MRYLATANVGVIPAGRSRRPNRFPYLAGWGYPLGRWGPALSLPAFCTGSLVPKRLNRPNVPVESRLVAGVPREGG